MLGKTHTTHKRTVEHRFLSSYPQETCHSEYVEGRTQSWGQAALSFSIHKHMKSKYTRTIMSLCVLNEVREGECGERDEINTL